MPLDNIVEIYITLSETRQRLHEIRSTDRASHISEPVDGSAQDSQSSPPPYYDEQSATDNGSDLEGNNEEENTRSDNEQSTHDTSSQDLYADNEHLAPPTNPPTTAPTPPPPYGLHSSLDITQPARSATSHFTVLPPSAAPKLPVSPASRAGHALTLLRPLTAASAAALLRTPGRCMGAAQGSVAVICAPALQEV